METDIFYFLLKRVIFVFIVQITLYYLLKKLSIKDSPDIRKIHKKSKLTAGGILFIVPFLILGGGIYLFNNLFVFSGFIIVFMTGFIDDIKKLSPGQKILLQIAAGVLMFYGGAGFNSFMGMENPFILFIITVFYYVSFINIINLIDGADGLATIISIIIVFGLALTGLSTLFKLDILFVLLISLAVFLFFNIKNSLIFMGDTGSNFLGFICGLFLINAGYSDFLIKDIIPFCLLIFIPFFDTLMALIRRVKNKKYVFSPDKGHIHHILIRKYGLNKTLIILGSVQIFSVLAGVYIKSRIG
ncbi:MAG: glycosyltransferase family 4 protein [Candidatus Muiribacteriota bacterium]